MELFDCVTLKVDLPEHGLTKGTRGTIVEVYGSPARAYELEFVDDEGYIYARVCVDADLVEPWTS